MNPRPSGIPGLDEICNGGIPPGRITLLRGNAGAGKTVLALQHLMAGSRDHGERGIYFTFEERISNLHSMAEGFGWPATAFADGDAGLTLIDARPTLHAELTGSFDLSGLLARANHLLQGGGPARIVFDGLDMLLQLLDNGARERLELARIYDWIDQHDATCIVTGQARDAYGSAPPDRREELTDYLADCVIDLRHYIEGNTSMRDVRVAKYRGMRHVADRCPLIIGDEGMQIGQPIPTSLDYGASTERIGTGIERLDGMLGGGVFRGTSILITGAPGTAKTTCAATMAAAACAQGDKALIVSFDEAPAQIQRNLSSIGLDLGTPMERGLLRIQSYRAGSIGAELQFDLLRRALDDHEPDLVVIDPLSAFGRPNGSAIGAWTTHRVLDLVKSRGITLVGTALIEKSGGESTTLDVSTIADTWLHLDFQVIEGERNRGLTIVKSRGTAHSNQVRELELSEHGVTLRDVYTAGGRVLMGTARMERERQIQIDAKHRTQDRERAAARLEAQIERLGGEIRGHEHALEQLRADQRRLHTADAEDDLSDALTRSLIFDGRSGETSDDEAGPPGGQR